MGGGGWRGRASGGVVGVGRGGKGSWKGGWWGAAHARGGATMLPPPGPPMSSAVGCAPLAHPWALSSLPGHPTTRDILSGPVLKIKVSDVILAPRRQTAFSKKYRRKNYSQQGTKWLLVEGSSVVCGTGRKRKRRFFPLLKKNNNNNLPRTLSETQRSIKKNILNHTCTVWPEK